jgi:hypothetical protein
LISCGLKEGVLKVGFVLTFITVSARDESGSVVSLRPNQHHNSALKQTKTAVPSFGVVGRPIFSCLHREIEDNFQIGKINPMRQDITFAFFFVPGNHGTILSFDDRPSFERYQAR